MIETFTSKNLQPINDIHEQCKNLILDGLGWEKKGRDWNGHTRPVDSVPAEGYCLSGKRHGSQAGEKRGEDLEYSCGLRIWL